MRLNVLTHGALLISPMRIVSVSAHVPTFTDTGESRKYVQSKFKRLNVATVLIYFFLLPSWSAGLCMDMFLVTPIKFLPFIYACVCAINEQMYVCMHACMYVCMYDNMYITVTVHV